MTYYLAEIRFNRTNENPKRERKRGKRLTMRLIALLFTLLMFSTLVIIVPAAVGSNQSEIIESLQNLSGDIRSKLPKEAFENPKAAEGQRGALCNKINAVIHQIEAGAYNGAVNKLRNDIKNTIVRWIADEEWENYLIEKVDEIIELILGIPQVDLEPPVIHGVWRDPETPEYDQSVTVTANVTDNVEVEYVILNYVYDLELPVRLLMKEEDTLYTATIPELPFGTTVKYWVNASDEAENWAGSNEYSYIVTDTYAPHIGVPTWDPEEPFADEEVKVSVSVSEPPHASGIKNVTLWYRTNEEWQFIKMITNEKWKATIPGQSSGVYVTFYIESFDNAGNKAETLRYGYTVRVPPGLPPVAKFTESEEMVLTGVAIHFDASESYDPDPDGYIVSYFWDFDDGTNSSDMIVDHIYVDDGVYTVTLRVTDNTGATATATSIKVVLNRPPFALFVEDATTVLTGQTICFDASSSHDLDGSIISYVWQFGDGTQAIGVSVNHAYEDDGIFIVTLTVTDDDGAMASNSSVKFVLNRPPVASFIENATTVKTNEVIHFDASGSYDQDGSIVSYFWDFGDGTNATTVTVDHAYAEEGNYTVTLTVMDDDGAVSSVSATKTVKAPVAPAGWPLAWLAAIGLGIAALTATLLYALYRRRKKGTASSHGSKPVVTLYVPTKILTGYD